MYLFLGKTKEKRVVAGITRFSNRKADCSQINERRRSKMHVQAISPCVTSRKADDDAFAAHARDARVEVLILTHQALFFPPYRARVHRLFSRVELLQNRAVLGEAGQWRNTAILKLH